MPNSNDFNHFAVNPVNIDISRSMFNMDHSVKFSCNVGEVIPFDFLEVVPGDTFSIDTTKVIRTQPMVAPIMDELIQDIYWFFVPHRLVWNHFVNFMGENTESAWAPETEYSIPQITLPTDGYDIGTIADYMGVPVKVNSTGSAEVSALPFRSYALICDQWFRSEAIMDPVHVHVDDTTRVGVNTDDQVTDIELGGKPFIACRFFDYFSAALPSPQRGDPVSFDLIDNVGKVPVLSLDKDDYSHPYNAGNYASGVVDFSPVHMTWTTANGRSLNDVSGDHPFYLNGSNSNSYVVMKSTNQTSDTEYQVYFDNLFVDLTNATGNAVTVNDLRTAFAIQKYLEKSARYGGRYQTFIKGFFGVDSPDARLQRTEYLGGSRISLNINSVEQTSATSTNTTPLGNVAGMSVTGDSHSDFTKSFTEHGYIIGCAVVRYHHSYQQGIHRAWLRKNKYEFYNPVFANLGEQEIRGDEIYFTSGNRNSVFGYQERWAEYRYQPSRVAGMMRSASTTPLDMWHLADYYSDAPSLSPDWLREDKTNLDRCLAVTSDVADQIICDFFIKTEASRPMPMYSIPGLIDHH